MSTSSTFLTKHKHENGFVSQCPLLLSCLNLNVIYCPVKLTGDLWSANVSVENVVICAACSAGLGSHSPLCWSQVGASWRCRAARPWTPPLTCLFAATSWRTVDSRSVQAHVTCRQLLRPPEPPSTLILLLRLSTLSGACQGPGGAADGSSGRSVCQEVHGFQLGPVPFHLGAGSIIIIHPDCLSLTLQRVYGIRFMQFRNLEGMDCLISVT